MALMASIFNHGTALMIRSRGTRYIRYILEYQWFNPLHLPLQSATSRYIPPPSPQISQMMPMKTLREKMRKSAESAD